VRSSWRFEDGQAYGFSSHETILQYSHKKKTIHTFQATQVSAIATDTGCTTMQVSSQLHNDSNLQLSSCPYHPILSFSKHLPTLLLGHPSRRHTLQHLQSPHYLPLFPRLHSLPPPISSQRQPHSPPPHHNSHTSVQRYHCLE
jgi:hypothetical protein